MTDDLSEFFQELAKEKKQKKEEFNELVGDLNLDSIFSEVSSLKKESKKKKVEEKKAIKAFEEFLFSEEESVEKEEKAEEAIREWIEDPVEEVVEEPEVESEPEEDLIEKSLGLLAEPEPEQQFATLDDLSKHYKIFIDRIQQQLSTLGGGGEVRLEFLDDVNRDSAKVDGRFLKYDANTGKFIGDNPVAAASEEAQKLVLDVRNNNIGYALTIGTPVYETDYNSGQDRINVEPSAASQSSTMPAKGVIKANLDNNTNGEIIVYGELEGVDTSSFDVADELYVAAAGGLTNTRPSSENDLVQKIAVVLKKSVNGAILVYGAGRTNDVPNTISIAGSITASEFHGDGSNLSGIVTSIIAGNNVTISGSTGAVTINASGGGESVATFTTTAGIATEAVRAGIATEAVSAGIATFATSAGIATYATTAGVSTYATSSGIATEAISAGIATYATSSGVSTYATSAGIATEAVRAGLATEAVSAGIATYATSSGVSTYATSSGIATEAVSAGIATYAATAGIATYATTAGIATEAVRAGLATEAVSAGIATFATTAGIASNAYWVKTDVGIHTLSRVGIGTSNPNQELEVFSDDFSGIRIKSSRTGLTDQIGGVGFSTSSDQVATINALVDGTVIVKNTTSDTERLRVTSAGNVGLGTDDPGNHKLHLHGETNSDLRLTATGDDIVNIFVDSDRSSANVPIFAIKGEWNGTQVAYMRFVAGDDTVNKDDGYITFGTRESGDASSTERARITSSGNIEVADGNLVFSTSGTGINLGNETLDEYDEGTFTPTYNTTNSNIGSVTYDNQVGRYVRIGKICYFSLRLRTDSISSVGTGNVEIRGFPFNHVNSAAARASMIVYTAGWTATDAPTLGLFVHNSDVLRLYQKDYNEDPTNLASSNLNTGANDNDIRISGVYEV
jgi:hypothetical protein